MQQHHHHHQFTQPAPSCMWNPAPLQQPPPPSRHQNAPPPQRWNGDPSTASRDGYFVDPTAQRFGTQAYYPSSAPHSPPSFNGATYGPPPAAPSMPPVASWQCTSAPYQNQNQSFPPPQEIQTPPQFQHQQPQWAHYNQNVSQYSTTPHHYRHRNVHMPLPPQLQRASPPPASCLCSSCSIDQPPVHRHVPYDASSPFIQHHQDPQVRYTNLLYHNNGPQYVAVNHSNQIAPTTQVEYQPSWRHATDTLLPTFPSIDLSSIDDSSDRQRSDYLHRHHRHSTSCETTTSNIATMHTSQSSFELSRSSVNVNRPHTGGPATPLLVTLGAGEGQRNKVSKVAPRQQPSSDPTTLHQAWPKASRPSESNDEGELSSSVQAGARPPHSNEMPHHGGNVHTQLQLCGLQFYSYRPISAHTPESRNKHANECDTAIPLFFQMVPMELKAEAVAIITRVFDVVCGPDMGTVVGVESRSETSFLVFIKTNVVWHIIYNLRYRVLMDRHGFWYAENAQQYKALKEYCETVRMLPQQERHYRTDGLPSMPLVVELSRSFNKGDPAVANAPRAPKTFDEDDPIRGTSSQKRKHHCRELQRKLQ